MLLRLWTRVRELVAPERLDRDTEQELAQHVELLAAEKQRSGLDAAEAKRQARLELGNPQAVREQLRDGRSRSQLDALARDLAYALRLLRRRPAFTAACLLTVALGTGASTALFAIVDAVVLRPLPLPEPGALVAIHDSNPRKGIDRTGITSGNLVDWRQRTSRFRGIAGQYTMGRTLTLGSESEVVLSAQVTEDYFAVLGVAAALGRTFTPKEIRVALFNNAAAPVSPDPVVVLGHGLWQRRFGSDPGVIGTTVAVERRPMRIVGVMPRSFAMPAPEVQLYLPWGLPEKPPLGPGPLPDGVVGPPLPPPSSLPQATNSERPRAAAASRQVFPVKVRM